MLRELRDWISIKDRCPPYDEEVIVCTDTYEVFSSNLVQSYPDYSTISVITPYLKNGWCLSEEEGSYLAYEKVKYWMPLPEPPHE
jgi:hypothetical protein